MGKKQRSGRKGGSAGSWANHRPRAEWNDTDKSNKLLEAYYNGLDIIPEDEKEVFWKVMRTDLPNSFRFTGSKGHALAVQQRLIDHYIPQITSVKFNGEFVETPKQVEWFPEKLAWSMTTPKQVIRKFSPFSSFQKVLVSETSVGNISRQEIVSMIPPLLMDIKPGMTVLDMCAAPGSKSAQLIEMVHGGEEARIRKVVHEMEREQQKPSSPDGKAVELEPEAVTADADWSDEGRTTGLLVANDSDYRRAQMLVHQVKRLNSPNLIVTNHDASIFPSIRIPSKPGSNALRYLKFDRILADVPCTGDGTARKNIGVWRDWMPSTGMGLHNLQVRILVRALQMLKVGGRAIYSTCSMNPVENEAVVATAIEACGGLANVQIVDCKAYLPGLKRREGLSTWKLMDKQQRFWATYEELELARSNQETENRDSLGKFTESMFPRQVVDGEDAIPLNRCMRVYPYLQDTGGFFITVLEKVSEIKVKSTDLKKPKVATDKQAVTAAGDIESDATKIEDLDQPAVELGAQLAEALNEADQESVKRKREVEEEEPIPTSPIKKAKTDDVEQPPSEEPPIPDEPTAQNGSKLPTAKPLAPDADQDVMTFKPRSNGIHEEPYKYLDPNHQVLETIYDFYQINTRFPRDRYMVRNATGEPVKAIYYTSSLVRDILTMNEGKGMKFVQAGVKMFMRQDAQGQDICKWRIQSEGTPILEPWIGEARVIRLNKQAPLRKLLIEMFIKINAPGFEDLGEVGQKIKDISMGCCLLKVEPSDDEDGIKERVVMPLWRSINAANIMLPKEERKAMLLRLFNDHSPLIDHSQIKNKDSKVEEKAQEDTSATADQPKEPNGDSVMEEASIKDAADTQD